MIRKTLILFVFIVPGKLAFAQNYLIDSNESASFVIGAIGVEETALFTSAAVGLSLKWKV